MKKASNYTAVKQSAATYRVLISKHPGVRYRILILSTKKRTKTKRRILGKHIQVFLYSRENVFQNTCWNTETFFCRLLRSKLVPQVFGKLSLNDIILLSHFRHTITSFTLYYYVIYGTLLCHLCHIIRSLEPKMQKDDTIILKHLTKSHLSHYYLHPIHPRRFPLPRSVTIEALNL